MADTSRQVQLRQGPDGKQPKSSVRYGRGGDHCGVCAFFIEPAEGEQGENGTCQKVEGDIGEDMWCKLFKRRARPLAGGGEYK